MTALHFLGRFQDLVCVTVSLVEESDDVLSEVLGDREVQTRRVGVLDFEIAPLKYSFGGRMVNHSIVSTTFSDIRSWSLSDS